MNRIKTLTTRIPFASLSIALLAISLPASAHLRHTIKPGETLGSIARKYHVDIKEIAAWNGLKNADRLSDGMSILIPTTSKVTAARAEKAPTAQSAKSTVAHSTMYRKAAIKGDRISVRVGPGTENRRLEMFDNGTPMIVTAERNGWAQVQMPNGKTGWTMLSYLKFNSKAPAPSKWVAKAAKPAPKTVKHLVKWTPAKPAVKKTVAKAEAANGKHTAKRANDRAWKIAYAKQIAAARKRNAEKKALAKIVRSAPRVAHRYIPEASAPEANNDIVRSAYSYRGTPYRYGGSAQGGFDCSGFTSYLYRQKGVSLPHSARAQATMGQKVDKANLRAGDLVFFHTVTPGISHVGMYVGDGKFVHASSRRSGGVRVDSLNSGYYSQRLRGARRYSK